jgi:hypothetical protein
MAPKRELIKGPLRPPQPQPRNQSYTQKPASKDEVSVRTGKEPQIPGEYAFSSVHSLTHSPLSDQVLFSNPKAFPRSIDHTASNSSGEAMES